MSSTMNAVPVATTTGHDAPKSPRRRRFRVPEVLLVTPAYALLAVFVLAPLALVVVLSLFKYDPLTGSGNFVGLANYSRILGSAEFDRALLNTFEYFVLTVPVTLAFGLLVALGIHALSWGATFWRAVYFLPVASTLAAMSVVWRFMFYPDTGIVDQTIGRLLGAHDWLNSSALVVPAVATVGVWGTVGFTVIIFLAGLATVPQDLHEAARLDGASAWSRFWHVTWPAIGPAFVFNLVIVTRNALRVFDEVRVMTGGGPAGDSNTLAYLIYKRGIVFLDIGGASVITVILLVLIVVIAGLQFLLMGNRLERGAAR